MIDLQLGGRVGIVTGASRGLGRSIATAFAEEGMQVVAAARSTDELNELEAAFTGQIRSVTCDVTDESRVAALVDEATSTFGGLDVIVNNAGIAPAGSFTEIELDEWRRVLDVNLLAPVVLTRAAAKIFLPQRSGKVINIGSLTSMRGKPTLTAYSASKGALIRLTEALAAEWAKHNVQVNLIAPGGFATEAQRVVLDSPDVLERRLRKIPARRLGESNEIGPLACYLASPLSNFVTGAALVIDGGELSKL